MAAAIARCVFEKIAETAGVVAASGRRPNVQLPLTALLAPTAGVAPTVPTAAGKMAPITLKAAGGEERTARGAPNGRSAPTAETAVAKCRRC